MAFCRVLALVALACVGVSGVSYAPKPTSAILAGFNADGFGVVGNVSFNGSRGFVAESYNTTLLSTGAHKLIYYIEGNAYELGYLHGLLAEESVGAMTNTYVDHFLISMISVELDQKLQADPTWSGLYDDFVRLLGDFLVLCSVAHFDSDVATGGIIPDYVLTEMEGLLKGCQASNPNTNVTIDRIITLNYGMDWLSAAAFSGHFLSEFQSFALDEASYGRVFARERRNLHLQYSTRLLAAVSTLERGDLQFNQYCDAMMVSGPATASGNGSLFGRDFQLATALVLQDLQTMFIVNPSDGRQPLVVAGAPGMVGGIAAMNVAGVMMGVDTLRSPLGTPESPGLNSLLIVRSTVHESASTEAAIDFVTAAKRGCPFLYPISDVSGNSVVIESAAFNASPIIPDPIPYIQPWLLPFLPDYAFLTNHSTPEYRNGSYVRRGDYQLPPEFLNYNPALFKLANVSYDPNSVTNSTGMVFPNFVAERNEWSSIGSNYFSPVRLPPHTVAVSNFAITPQLRMTEMNFWSDLFPGDAMQYRYDRMSQIIHDNYGKFDFQLMKQSIQFLSPEYTPGYWVDTLDPNDPMSAQVQGLIAVGDLQSLTFALKGGYWADGWCTISLTRYV